MNKESKFKKNSSHGFTLIELLIVIAIIAILALIAVPNFLDAQVRAKVSRCLADMRSLDTALESYGLEHGEYPIADPSANWYPLSARMRSLTTPIAFMTKIPPDPFPEVKDSAFPPGAVDTFDYWSLGSAKHVNGGTGTLFGGLWRLASAGPYGQQSWGQDPPYDPTNGTTSPGEIVRVQGKGFDWWPYERD